MRRVARVDPATRRPARGAGGPSLPDLASLDSEDPAIPFSRVPYVPADLRRVGIMAGLMILLIVIADLLVTHLVK